MSSFPGIDANDAVLARARAELKKTILTAAAPRTPLQAPTTGGYGLTLPAAHLPENWGSGRISATHDALCPILGRSEYVELDTGDKVGGPGISPFTYADILGETDTALGANLRGCGYIRMWTEAASAQSGGEGGLGVSAAKTWPIVVAAQIFVPRRHGDGQLYLYAGLLARIFANARIQFNSDEHVHFFDVMETATDVDETGTWLAGSWIANAEMYYRTSYPWKE